MTNPTPPERRALFGAAKSPPPVGERWLSVLEVNELGRKAVESAVPWVKVQAEVSNVTYAASGHLYFTLKDERAQISAVMWRSAVQRMPQRLTDGAAVKAQGTVTIYPARGTFQMVVERMEPAGRGSLEERLRKLKKHYEDLGYFAAERKRPLPFLPRTIGVVTSRQGAAVHDILRTIGNRFARAHVLLVPVRVQGEGSAREIAAAIHRLNEGRLCDVMIVGRGGGSLEDLWAFNEADVIEAIYASEIPVISAVGHEIDVTLSDLVADRRALTPTNAGEIVCPNLAELEEEIGDMARRATQLLRAAIRSAKERVLSLSRSWALRQPKRLIERRMQRIDELTRGMTVGLTRLAERARRRLQAAVLSPAWARLVRVVDKKRSDVDRSRRDLDRAIVTRLGDARRRLEVLEARLIALSPERVLERGFSITLDANGRILRDAAGVLPGDRLTTRLAGGEIASEVLDVRPAPPDGNGPRF